MRSCPNFIIVGAAKAGTTSLYKYLDDHPDVFMSENKEPTFFSYANENTPEFSLGRKVKFITDPDEYFKLFETVKNEKCIGEASTPYLYFFEKSISNIKKYLPNHQNIKIIIILRNPVERAYSQYMMKVRDLTETMSFEDAIKNEPIRIENNGHFDFFYVDRGFYFKQVKAFLDNFANVKILLFDDLKKDPKETLNGIYDFLDISKQHSVDTGKHYNVSGQPKFKILRRLILEKNFGKTLIKAMLPKTIRQKLAETINSCNMKKMPLKEKTRKELVKLYKNDIIKLESLINRDLSEWYTDKS